MAALPHLDAATLALLGPDAEEATPRGAAIGELALLQRALQE